MKWLVTVGAALAVWPAAANAATVSVRPFPQEVLVTPLGSQEVAYVAGPGEANRVVAKSAAVGSAWIVSDSGAVIAPGAGCVAVDAHTARCVGADVGLADARLGDGDDVAVLVQGDAAGVFPLYADGGTGNDVLSLPAHGQGELHGGPGDDVLTSATDISYSGGYGSLLDYWVYDAILDGGGGRDTLHGGSGNELLSDGDVDAAAGPDVIDGGGGIFDTVNYGARTRPVSVDLQAGRGGAVAEADTLTGIEDVVGGHADDRLAGDGLPNTLDGQGGANTLIGRDAGDTFVNARGRVSCGDGEDTIFGSSAHDFLSPDCELVNDGAVVMSESYPAYPVAVARRSVRFQVHCATSDLDGHENERVRCSGRITLREPGGERRRLGRGAFPPGQWAARAVKVVLTPLGRRLATRRRGVRATVRLTKAADYPPVQRWTIRLKTRPH